MATYKSTAVTSGIMPDYSRAGVMLCRYGSYTAADDSIVSGDTLQLVPIPSGARIIDVIVEHPAMDTGQDIGYGGDPNAFADTDDWSSAGVYSMVGAGVQAGQFLKFTHDDTIDWAIQGTKIPTSATVSMTVIYNMTGSIADDS